jgi:hypothetical protein
MERIYIRIWYLKSLHYFFFSLAVFSVTAGIVFFDFMAWESLSFFVLGYFYCLSSLLIAYYFYKDYRETVEPLMVIKLYFLPYMVLSLWTIGTMVLLIWTLPHILSLLYTFLFVDYYIFFFIVIGFALSRFRIVSKLFEMYNIFILRNAMRIAKKYASFVDVTEYSIGNSPETDEILDEIWAHRDYPLPFIRKLELSICDKHVIDINNMLNRMRREVATEKIIIKTLNKEKEYYLKKIVDIQQKVD